MALEKLLDETSYLLDKAIWEKYDMIKTKANVCNFLTAYKESHALAIRSIALNQKLVSNISDAKVFSSVRTNTGGFAEDVNRQLDAEILIGYADPLIREVKKTFTEKEKAYYEYCLAQNFSEDFILPLIEISSRTGLKPIKNSCILKVAFIFDLQVLKANTSL